MPEVFEVPWTDYKAVVWRKTFGKTKLFFVKLSLVIVFGVEIDNQLAKGRNSGLDSDKPTKKVVFGNDGDDPDNAILKVSVFLKIFKLTWHGIFMPCFAG